MLIIETGAGVADADTFIDAMEFDAITVEVFGGPMKGDKDAALRRAWLYMASLDWKASQWPAFGGAVPDAIKRAQAMLARIEVQFPGTLEPRVKSRKGEPVEEDTRPAVQIAMGLLAPYLGRA